MMLIVRLLVSPISLIYGLTLLVLLYLGALALWIATGSPVQLGVSFPSFGER